MNNTLFIDALSLYIRTGEAGALKTRFSIVALFWILVFVAIVVDGISGIYKAKRAGELRTSYGFSRSLTKILVRYGVLAFALIFDFMISVFGVLVPVCTAVASIIIVAIEAFSVYEKADEKHRRVIEREARHALELIRKKDDILNGFADVVEKKLDQSNENIKSKQ